MEELKKLRKQNKELESSKKALLNSQKAYKKQQKFLNNVIESLTHPFYVINVDDYSIQMANKASGIEKSASLNTCYAITHKKEIPCDSKDHFCPLKEVIRTKKSVQVEHVHYVKGQKRIFEVHGHPIFNEKGEVVQMIEYSLDITERKMMEKKLQNALAESQNAKMKAEKSNQLKSAFLANMSHEIRTPMNAIIGYTDLLLEGEVKEERKEYLQIIRNSGNLLLSIIDDILDLSKIQAGELKIEKIPVKLNSIFEHISSYGQMFIKQEKKNIELRQYISNNLNNTLSLDQTRLLQVMTNLLSNAIKFTSEGFIEYGVSLKNNSQMEFYVRDTGIGIEKDKENIIFNPFLQADVSTTRKFGGTGLGLTITKKLIELMGGEISFRSCTKKNHGSTFFFNIPYEPVKTKESRKENREKIKKNTHRGSQKILVVEDNIVNLVLTEKILIKSGYKVEKAKDGRDAVSKYKTTPDIDLILMDVQMPVLNGLDATKVIRDLRKPENGKNEIPIIALTAGVMAEDKENCFNAGCVDVISKPVNLEKLIGTIRKYL